MAKTTDVVAGGSILSAWGNEVRDRTVQVFASAGERDAWAAPEGSVCFQTDVSHMYVRRSGVWTYVSDRKLPWATNVKQAGNVLASSGTVYADLSRNGDRVSGELVWTAATNGFVGTVTVDYPNGWKPANVGGFGNIGTWFWSSTQGYRGLIFPAAAAMSLSMSADLPANKALTQFDTICLQFSYLSTT